jgi:hypothetical protein
MNNNTLIKKKICWLFWENLKLAKEINPQQTEVLIHEIKAAKRILLWLQEGAGLHLKWQLCDLCTGVYCIHSRRN